MIKTDRQITISIGGTRSSLSWARVSTTWLQFCDRLKDPIRFAGVSVEDFRMMSTQQRATLKDVGGFVGGTFAGERRLSNQCTGRDLITLDVDNLPAGSTEKVIKSVQVFGAPAVIYSTAKHRPDAPRLRVVILLDRTATTDEYEPITRMIAKKLGIGMECFDPCSFEVHQFMYWPSCPEDAQAVYCTLNESAPALDPEKVLLCYADEVLDWSDERDWPRCPGESEAHKRTVDKAQDPTTKGGWIGYFCQVYDVPAVIDKYLADVYEPTNDPSRYALIGSKSMAGANIYNDGAFMYSEHATDPAYHQNCNAFDLVRLHKFRDLDADAAPGTPVNRLPSYNAMLELCSQDEAVKQQAARAQIATAFSKPIVLTDGTQAELITPGAVDLPDWLEDPQISKDGSLKTTTNNIMLKWETDPALQGAVLVDTFSHKMLVTRRMPWDAPTSAGEERRWKDADDAGFRKYAEARWGMTGVGKMADAVVLIAEHYATNRVADWLESLTWDGVPRVETIFIDYLGAEDNIYIRSAALVTFRAAVARAMATEGHQVKFDNMPVLVGPQGCGKSTFVRHLGVGWFLEGLATFGDVAAMEAIQGKWIVEVSEMAALSRADDAAAKQFLTKEVDSFRVPYGKSTQDYQRRAIFFGTVNDVAFLRDTTGNRRYWPIDVDRQERQKDVFDELPDEVEQIWAEAVQLYKKAGDRRLHLVGDAALMAKAQQDAHTAGNDKAGMIRSYLETIVPEDWYTWATYQKIAYMNEKDRRGEQLRKTCALEVWTVVFRMQEAHLKNADAKMINDAIRTVPGWTEKRLRFGVYGYQRGFERA